MIGSVSGEDPNYGNLYLVANALSVLDVDSTVGLSAVSGSPIITSVPSTGTSDFAVNIESGNVNSLFWVNPAPTVGVMYKHSFWAKAGQLGGSTKFALKIAEGWEVEQNISLDSTDWTYYEYYNTRIVGNGDVNFYATRAGTGQLGDSLQVEEYRCKAV